MARTKSAVAKNIKSKITGKIDSFSGDDLTTFAKLNVAVGESVNNISAHIEKLSEHEMTFFKQLIDEIKKIPQNAAEFEKQQQQIYQNLIKTSAILRDQVEKEQDENKKKPLQEALDDLQKRGREIEQNLPRNPRTFKERLAKQQFGGDPREVAQKGFFGALFAQSRRERAGNTGPTFDEIVNAEEQVAKIQGIKIPEKIDDKKTVKEKTKNNLKGLVLLNNYAKSLLTEVTVIRKIVEGRIKFDPNSKGNQYYQIGPGGQKLSITSESIRSPGRGLFTKKELGEKLGLTPSEIKKKKLSELEELSLQHEKQSALKRVAEGVSEKMTDETKFEEKNENVERSTAIEKASEQKYTGSGSDIISEGNVKNTSTPMLSTNSGRGISDVISGNVIGGVGNLIKKGASKLFNRGKIPDAKGIEKAGAKGIEKAGAKGASKILGKGLGKSVLKKIPLIGLAAGIGFGVHRLMRGDVMGAAGELASGAVSTIPGLGTAASVAIDAGLAARDIKNESVDAQIEPVQQTEDTSDVSQMLQKAQQTGNLAHTKVQAAKNQAGAVIENKQIAAEEQIKNMQQPVQNITNITNNNQTVSGSNDNTTYFMPPVRSPDPSFMRYQDKRMARIL